MKLKSALKPLAIVSGILLSPAVLAGGYGGHKPPDNGEYPPPPPPVEVPEPSALALLGLGVAAMAIQRRRRDKDAQE